MITIRTAGDAALLVDVDPQVVEGAGQDGTEAACLAAGITAAALTGVTDVVPGAATVLVRFEPGVREPVELAGELRLLAAGPLPDPAGPDDEAIVIGTVYDGPDLAEVAVLTGLLVPEVIARHLTAEYRVGWLGFSPGFGYLTGLDPLLAAVPRLDSPRQSVPAGSVAIAGGLAAVYPAASPGGWRLLGRTDAVLWDPDRQPPSLLTPGRRVRFRAVRSAAVLAHAGSDPGPPDPGTPDPGTPDPGTPDYGALAPAAAARRPAAAAARARPAPERAGRLIQVLQPGPLTTIQDLGRPGFAHLGVPRSGAADQRSLRLANRLAGNDDDAACLEVTLGRLALRFDFDAIVALTGAPTPVRLSVAGGGTADDSAAGDSAAGSGDGGGAAEASASGPATPSPAIADPAAPGAATPDPAAPGAAGFGTVFAVPAGTVLRLGSPPAGLRSYVAVAGGIDVPAVLGSRSADVLSGLGPRPRRPGEWLRVGRPRFPTGKAEHQRPDSGAPAGLSGPDAPAGPSRPGAPAGLSGPGAPAGPSGSAAPAGLTVLRAIAGPRADWFAAGSIAELAGGSYQVSPASNRTGLRLTGPPLRRAHVAELPSEGIAAGSLQVSHDGQPILLLADHPTTGGYPVIAVVVSEDLSLAAQLRPGQLVRFEIGTPPVL